MPSDRTEPLFNNDDVAVIRQALFVAADCRLIEICQSLGLSTIDAGNFRDRCAELHEGLGHHA